jgi:FSR family fosmidomycin resistance protein-like MFS transporter
LIPANASVAAAITMGFAWGMGGLAVPIVGKIGDLTTLPIALMVVAVLPVAGFVLSLGLSGKRARMEKATVVLPAASE